MPILDGSNSVSGTSVANVTTPAWTAAGNNRLLLAGMGWGGLPVDYSAIRWGGAGGTLLTQLGSTLETDDNAIRGAVASLVAPATGSQTLYGEVSGLADEICVGGATWTDVAQAMPPPPATAIGISTAPLVSAFCPADGIVVDMMFCFDGDPTPTSDASQTLLWDEFIDTIEYGAQSYRAGVGTTPMSWTTANDDWLIFAVSLVPPRANARLRPSIVSALIEGTNDGTLKSEVNIKAWY